MQEGLGKSKVVSLMFPPLVPRTQCFLDPSETSRKTEMQWLRTCLCSAVLEDIVPVNPRKGKDLLNAVLCAVEIWYVHGKEYLGNQHDQVIPPALPDRTIGIYFDMVDC